MDSLDRTFLDRAEEVSVVLIEKVVHVEADTYVVESFDEFHHLLSVSSEACAWEVLDTENCADFSCNRSEFCDRCTAALDSVGSVIRND